MSKPGENLRKLSEHMNQSRPSEARPFITMAAGCPKRDVEKMNAELKHRFGNAAAYYDKDGMGVATSNKGVEALYRMAGGHNADAIKEHFKG